MKTYTLPILWSIRVTPKEIRKMLSDQRITDLITIGKFRCRIGSFIRICEPRAYVVSPEEPHGLISDIYDDKDGWYGDVTVPEIGDWIECVDKMTDPVLHPMVQTDGTSCRIVLFNIIERSELRKDRVYEGKTLPPTPKLETPTAEEESKIDLFKIPDPTAHDAVVAIKTAMSKWDKLFREEVNGHNDSEEVKKLILTLSAQYVKGLNEMVDKAIAELGITDNNE